MCRFMLTINISNCWESRWEALFGGNIGSCGKRRECRDENPIGHSAKAFGYEAFLRAAWASHLNYDRRKWTHPRSRIISSDIAVSLQDREKSNVPVTHATFIRCFSSYIILRSSDSVSLFLVQLQPVFTNHRFTSSFFHSVGPFILRHFICTPLRYFQVRTKLTLFILFWSYKLCPSSFIIPANNN